jgi:hypothetical protein
MILLIEPANGLKPSHYIINNTCNNSKNYAYNDLEAYEEAKQVDGILNGKENIIYGEIQELGDYYLVNEMDLDLGAECRANNKGKIL